MARTIRFCKACDKYTMQEKCPVCDAVTEQKRPPKYSPDDKYADIKRGVKKEEYEKRGLL
ncbi:ribosome biogenesis protein [Candidatus Woesearchaeota archaeon]|nr:ribosome biogenesis protein [Candidatus Woesearchaeota archaeon]